MYVFVTHKFTHSLTNMFFFIFLVSSKIKAILCILKIMSMLNMFSFDVFSVCHSLGQLVAGLVLFIFWLMLQEHRFDRK